MNWSLILKKIQLVHDEHEFNQALHKLRPEQRNKPTRVAFVNAHAVNLCIDNPEFLENLLSCDFVFRDGSGMSILYRLLGCAPGYNLVGTDFIPEIIKLYSSHNAALLGTHKAYLDCAAELILRENGVKTVCILDGFQDDKAYLEAIEKNPASLIILGMGMPKQERVANLLARNLKHPCLIICGGAILDFLGGKVIRAPAIFRRFGMEWFFRLILEPRRLFRRYVIGNFVFLFRIARLVLPSNRSEIKTS